MSPEEPGGGQDESSAQQEVVLPPSLSTQIPPFPPEAIRRPREPDREPDIEEGGEDGANNNSGASPTHNIDMLSSTVNNSTGHIIVDKHDDSANDAVSAGIRPDCEPIKGGASNTNLFQQQQQPLLSPNKPPEYQYSPETHRPHESEEEEQHHHNGDRNMFATPSSDQALAEVCSSKKGPITEPQVPPQEGSTIISSKNNSVLQAANNTGNAIVSTDTVAPLQVQHSSKSKSSKDTKKGLITGPMFVRDESLKNTGNSSIQDSENNPAANSLHYHMCTTSNLFFLNI